MLREDYEVPYIDFSLRDRRPLKGSILASNEGFDFDSVPKVVAVPYWIEKVIIASGGSLLDLLEEKTARKYLGQSDINDIMAINGHIEGLGLDANFLFKAEKSCVYLSDEQINSSLGNVFSKLCSDKDKLSCIEKSEIHSSCYEVKLIEGVVFLIIKEYFIQAQQDPTYTVELYRDILKAMLSVSSFEQVSFTVIYERYLKYYFN